MLRAARLPGRSTPTARSAALARLTSLSIQWLAVSALLLSTAASAPAAEIEGISFPESIAQSDAPLELAGLGLLRYRVLFRGYVGGLYLPSAEDRSKALLDVPKALELSYFWSIKGKLFGDAAVEILRRQHGDARVEKYRSSLDALHALYKDVEPGDRYRLHYRPGLGTELSLNGASLGTVPGAEFASDYFGIWLGADPIDESFRDAILAGR